MRDPVGVPYTVTTAEVHFSYNTSSGDLIQALAAGWSMRTDGVWATAEYAAATKANQEKVMAQIQAYSEEVARQHNRNMAWIQRNGARHQARLSQLHQ